MYADDTAIIVSGTNAEVIFGSVLFGSKRKLHKHNTIQVQCASNILTCHTHVKYLGAKLDQSLSGDGMAENVVSNSNAG